MTLLNKTIITTLSAFTICCGIAEDNDPIETTVPKITYGEGLRRISQAHCDALIDCGFDFSEFGFDMAQCVASAVDERCAQPSDLCGTIYPIELVPNLHQCVRDLADTVENEECEERWTSITPDSCQPLWRYAD